MRRGRKPVATAAAPAPLSALPRCPAHLDDAARREWRRLATPLHEAGLLTIADRAVLAACCQAWSRWVEAEEKLRETPALLKTPSGYVQQSPWLSVANKQLELMVRFVSELGLSPAARTRLGLSSDPNATDRVTMVFRTIVSSDTDAATELTRVEGDTLFLASDARKL